MIFSRNLCKTIFVFGNGLDALEHLESTLSTPQLIPDVILLDITMPIMDGWQFLDQFKNLKSSISKEVSIYMLTLSVDYSDMIRAKGYPDVVDYLVKPLTLNDLEIIFN